MLYVLCQCCLICSCAYPKRGCILLIVYDYNLFCFVGRNTNYINSEVGAPLYKIDTEATEPEEGFFEVAGVGGEEEEAAAAASTGRGGGASSADGASGTGRSGGHTRIPSIHFLGKAGWAKKLSAPVRDAAADIAAGVPPAVGGPAPTSVEVVVGPNYGRPPITEREMEALILGGAEEAPKMKAPSGPALFGF